MKIAINGFGRIGRAVFKIIVDRAQKGENLEIVAINDLTDTENLAYLLRYDSVYGRYENKVTFDENSLMVGDKRFPVYAQKDPSQLPWKDLNVDVVIESTGVFKKFVFSSAYLFDSAKKVILTAPAKDDGFKTYVIGADVSGVKENALISNASCTTNNISPVMKILEDNFGIEKSLMTTVHAYTATQGLVDGPAKKDVRRGRAAAQNIVPSSTGAAIATGKVLPSVVGKFDGLSLRVPVICGSISDITAVLKRDVTVEEINKAFADASQSEQYKGVVAYTTEPLVSSDVIKTPFSCIIEGDLTRVVGGNMIKVMAWYDNEWGYSTRVVDLLSYC